MGRILVVANETLRAPQLEEVLLTADIGVKTSHRLFEAVKARLDREHLRDPAAVWDVIQDESRKLLSVDRPALDVNVTRPFVILTIGVNGVGKTTTIGKLAHRFKAEGRSLMLAAGDTFRAAAVAQLQAWGERNGVAVVAQGQDADPASVAFDALQAAKARGTDVLTLAQHFLGRYALQAGKAGEQAGFAGAVWAQESKYFAFFYGKRQRLQSHEFPVCSFEFFDLESVSHC